MGREPMQLTDELAMQIIDDLGEKMSWVMNTEKAGSGLPSTPEQVIAMGVIFTSMTMSDFKALISPGTMMNLAAAKVLAMPGEPVVNGLRDLFAAKLTRESDAKT